MREWSHIYVRRWGVQYCRSRTNLHPVTLDTWPFPVLMCAWTQEERERERKERARSGRDDFEAVFRDDHHPGRAGAALTYVTILRCAWSTQPGASTAP